MSDRPSIARGFLFADLRNYSAWVEARGDHAAATLLSEYRDLVRAAVADFSGAEIRTEGDSFYVAFGSPSAAVLCGLRILDRAGPGRTKAGLEEIPVGVGVHAGETVETDEGYVGSAVNIAARVCARAAAGELLVTDAVRAITRTYLDVQFTPRGRRKLKGIDEPIVLYRVDSASSDRKPGRPSVGSDGWRRGRWAALPALMILASVTAWVIGPMLGRQDDATGETDSHRMTATANSATGASSRVSAGPTPDGYPNAAETELLDRLPGEVARHCERAEAADVPTYEDDPTIIPLAYDAGLECRLGSSPEPDVVWYWQAVPGQRIDLVNGIFYQTVGRRTIPQGDCADTSPAYGPWTLGDGEGQILCYGSRDAILLWTYENANILAKAQRSDGDSAALYRWWRESARLLGS